MHYKYFTFALLIIKTLHHASVVASIVKSLGGLIAELESGGGISQVIIGSADARLYHGRDLTPALA